MSNAGSIERGIVGQGMPREFARNRRVARFIKQELSLLIQREFPLREHGLITLTGVDVSPDLKNATIFITTLNGNPAPGEAVLMLNGRARHFRHEIARVMTARRVPELNFKHDESIERARRLRAILDSFAPARTEDE